ncbi:MAG: NADH dehydrogenase (quinone) subunit D [Bacteroidetes bacterium]|nr:NADH dehydrogenase (quinone) subunit D [Bacteroidota bacterium]MBU1422429.1 NADH dehydrogenase (quinone) subunit D [Bacteroidota bacterium]MBU2635522.1 NADH dehydrogenase (quinone) subunit D [Bacteroidota bacterium]
MIDTKEKSTRSKILEALESQDVSVYFDDPIENEMVLNMGPQHPATHGVLRLLIRLNGETILGSVADVGYLHRGYEKLAENMTFHEYIPYTDRLDYLSPLANNVAYVLAVEKLAGIEAPRRAQFIRVVIAEMARIMSHLVAVGSTAMDVGALTVLLWCFREREKLQDIQDIFAGVRFTTSFTRIGGLANDMSEEAIGALKSFLEEFPGKLDEIERLLLKNRIFIQRCEGVGVISKHDAIAMGLTGPILRASGVAHDLRRDEPYLVYPELDFDIPVYEDGDSLARFYIRLQEMKESVKIIHQAIDKMPKGPINAALPKKVLPQKEKIYGKMEELIHDFMLINFGINPPVGEIYQAIENSKGELGFYISSLGQGSPWRLKIHSPSFINIQALPILLKGHLVSDVVAIIGSIDPVMGEADK